ncbi:hypothetical protein C2E23DRAFT_853605, partial [Lenzites betulinus]
MMEVVEHNLSLEHRYTTHPERTHLCGTTMPPVRFILVHRTLARAQRVLSLHNQSQRTTPPQVLMVAVCSFPRHAVHQLLSLKLEVGRTGTVKFVSEFTCPGEELASQSYSRSAGSTWSSLAGHSIQPQAVHVTFDTSQLEFLGSVLQAFNSFDSDLEPQQTLTSRLSLREAHARYDAPLICLIASVPTFVSLYCIRLADSTPY